MAIETESYFVSWPHPKMETPPNSGSAPNASSSPTRRWENNGIIHTLLDSLVDLVQEELYAEKCTAMAGYITMLSFFSTQHTTLETSLRLMQEVLTPISNQYDGLLERHTTMCARMGIPYSATSPTTILNVQGRIREVRGVTSLLHQTEMLFLKRSAAWIHELSCAHLQALRSTQTGHTETTRWNTNPRSHMLSEMTGSEVNSRNGLRPPFQWDGGPDLDGESTIVP